MPTLTGVVVRGFGAATRDTRNGVYDLKYTPWPGTLNLRVVSGDVTEFGEPEMTVEHVRVTRRLWPMTVDGHSGHLLYAGRTDPVIVELLAPVRLRDALDVDNGDTVTVEVG